MEIVRNRYLIIIAILSVVAVMVASLSYDVFAKTDDGLADIAKIPKQIGKWQGTDIYLEPSIYDILETKSIIHRSYHSTIGDVFLSVVHYPDTKVDFHAPEACLGGKGIKIVKTKKVINVLVNEENRKIEVNQLLYDSFNEKEIVYYFYKAGSYLGNNYIKMRLNLALNKFVSNNRSGSLIRLSSDLDPLDPEKTHGMLKNLLSEIMPYINDL